jgi:hypothetical protein
MKNQIAFTTDIFETRERKANFLSDRNFGEDLARWLVEISSGGDFKFGEPFQEAEGWFVPVSAGGESFIIGVGVMDASIGDEQADWLLTIEKKRKWGMGSKDSTLRSELCDHIQNVLRDKAHIREIRWTDEAGHFAR